MILVPRRRSRQIIFRSQLNLPVQGPQVDIPLSTSRRKVEFIGAHP